jgi:hypothetical protein
LSKLTRPTYAEIGFPGEQPKKGGASGEDAKHVCHWYHRAVFSVPSADRALERVRTAVTSTRLAIVAAGVCCATAAHAQTMVVVPTPAQS